MNQFDLNKPQVMATWSASFFTKLHRYRTLLKRRWWVLLASLAVCIAYQSVKIAQTAPIYISRSKMMVSPRISVMDKVSYSEELNSFIGTQIELMRGAEVHTRAMNRVKAVQPELPQSAVGLDVYQTPRTSIFEFTATGSEPRFTQAYLDAVMREFIKYKDEMRSQTSDKTLSSLTEQLLRLDKELKEYQEKLFDFQKQNDVIFLQEQGNTAAQYLANLDREMADMKKEYQLLDLLSFEDNLRRANLAAQKDQQAAGKTPAPGNPNNPDSDNSYIQEGPESDYLKTKKELQILNSNLDELSVNLKPLHPKIIKMKSDIARQERLLEIYKTQGIEQLKARQNTLKVRLENAAKIRSEYEPKALDSSRKMADYARLKADVERVKGLYNRLLDTVQNIDVSSNINQTEIEILEFATAPQSTRPDFMKGVLTGAIVGFVIGIGILFLLDRIDDRVNSFTELREYFDEQVLGQIPLESASGGKRVEILKREDSRQVYSEAFRNIRSSLMYMAVEGERPKTILVTSAIPNEGKSTVSCNLAITMAFAGSRVLLIDADMRKGLLHAELNIPATPGLSEILAQKMSWQEVVSQTPYENLHFIPRGHASAQVGELLLNPATILFLQHVRNEYDYVIIDSAPILATDDTPSLAPKIDGTLMVLRASHTSMRLSRNSLDALYQRQVNVLGIVFNCIDTNLPDYYHYQYYKYYYSST
ncbi:MAG: polysaccharide biosynthesis tyrosine autokinase [Methylacidiphilales bacterium]|nr:polysaccharide biosynthesis tyrosine autokinase [Candidatus Methylacidiphilales bacterium]